MTLSRRELPSKTLMKTSMTMNISSSVKTNTSTSEKCR